ncbi:uncharacterized protein PFL1_05149 [Pseudozyma flocculosa PF-1]|uniref:Glutathione synthetase n=1 Tax=Pseudozyma flocculosa PF-1 TaxID=1277687 RepID=A0A061H9E0_9BASI|nr:uncharacterized protein PFL1_05149 [Pseudozyma flocculosa PF-1]EPQ27226.1 hypothetical protein PFL1_05149 [Pseudozyma flocculosa PF-1]
MANTTPNTLPTWPPSSLTVQQIGHLAHLATDYALANGIVYRPLPPPASSSPSSSSSSTDAPAPTPPYDSVIHAPFSLVPSPFPRPLFDYAQSLQPTYDVLYASLASSPDFLKRVVGGSVSKVDSFQASLWKIYQHLQNPDRRSRQRLGLGLFRSDYLLHRPDDDEDGKEGRASELQLKQVEFNTISASFGALCTKVAALHRHVARNSAGYFGAHDGKLAELDRLPENEALDVLSSGLAAAHKAYLEQRGLAPAAADAAKAPLPLSPVVLFVVQEHERNAFDQRWIEDSLTTTHGIPVLRQTFTQLQTSAMLEGADRRLHVVPSYGGEAIEVSVVYFRAGYGPGDYPTQSEWELRERLESSYAIKCPTVALQLAGAKKVQQVLSEPQCTESILLDAAKTGGRAVSKDEVERVRQSYTDLYPLDASALGQEAYRLARAQPHRFVMKPQREGGGNNVYRHDIPPALDEMERLDAQGLVTPSTAGSIDGGGGGEGEAVKRREGYILMSLIQPPPGIGNWLVKASSASSVSPGAAVLAHDVVSELGVYGSILYRDHDDEGAEGKIEARESDEGGVAVGFSVIDSPVLL